MKWWFLNRGNGIKPKPDNDMQKEEGKGETKRIPSGKKRAQSGSEKDAMSKHLVHYVYGKGRPHVHLWGVVRILERRVQKNATVPDVNISRCCLILRVISGVMEMEPKALWLPCTLLQPQLHTIISTAVVKIMQVISPSSENPSSESYSFQWPAFSLQAPAHLFRTQSSKRSFCGVAGSFSL